MKKFFISILLSVVTSGLLAIDPAASYEVVPSACQLGWHEVGYRCGIGTRRLWRGPALKTDNVRLRIINASACPAISKLGLYLEPEL